MTDRPETRKTHITRILGTNRAGDRLDDVWADIERIDVIKSRENGQGVQRKLHWCDDPDADDYARDGNPARITEIIKLCDVENETDPNDPEVWIPIRVIKGMKSAGGSGQGDHFMDRFLDAANGDSSETSRVFEVRRFVHHDTNIDVAAQAAFNANPQRTEYVVRSEDYVRNVDDPEARDASQYLEHEVVTYVKGRGNSLDTSGVNRQSKLLNDYLFDLSENATQKVVGSNGTNPPYRLDPFQNIRNVNFGGSAVEFPDESYIELPQTVPPSKKVFMSIWFRVPAASLAAAKAEYNAWHDAWVEDPSTEREPLTGIVPIAVFGTPRTAKKVDFVIREVGTLPAVQSYIWDTGICGWSELGDPTPAQSDEESHWVFNDETLDIDPSYIGIDCSGNAPKLSINLVMPSTNLATFEGSWPVISSFESSTDLLGQYGSVTATSECVPPIGNHLPGDGSICDLEHHYGVLPFNDITNTITYESNADVVMGYRPETFRTVPNIVGDLSFAEHFLDRDLAGGQEVTSGVWHHLLLSFDLTNSCRAHGVLGDGSPIDLNTEGSRTSSACRLWIALDDVNLTQKALSCYWPSGYSDPNAILPVNGYFVAGDLITDIAPTAMDDCFGNNITVVNDQQQPDFTYSPAAFAPGQVSFPGSAPFVSMNKRIEMGEAQLFTDVTANTALKNVRRAFITDNGTPAGLKAARDLFNKAPEVLVHGSSNWKKARNTGSLADPSNNPGGVVVGQIKTFKPNPKLGK
ncbi:hypothetical protein [Bradyrhizobium elkanii]|uniref:Uncharacterized protein n=1 Tax=Bradyrhizobium elkanii TaxID=29448 RepID=A0A8I1Y9M8_BRAEL|nr:hypothetical protein [Bradyrhizobium elkanii]MBP1297469.1 hypothetical protein [Bradyrhizobium elkanii]